MLACDLAVFGFTLSDGEFAGTLLTDGREATLPLDIFGTPTDGITPIRRRRALRG